MCCVVFGCLFPSYDFAHWRFPSMNVARGWFNATPLAGCDYALPVDRLLPAMAAATAKLIALPLN
jgi:hypothetical protein